jgi:hypothetical protein
MDTEQITLTREQWESIRRQARGAGDGINTGHNNLRVQAGGFPGSSHEAGIHWAVGRIISEGLESAPEGDSVTLALSPVAVRDMKFHGYLPQEA